MKHLVKYRLRGMLRRHDMHAWRVFLHVLPVCRNARCSPAQTQLTRCPPCSSCMQYGASSRDPSVAVHRTIEFRSGVNTISTTLTGSAAQGWTLSATANGKPVSSSVTLANGVDVTVIRFDPPANGVRSRVVVDAGGRGSALAHACLVWIARRLLCLAAPLQPTGRVLPVPCERSGVGSNGRAAVVSERHGLLCLADFQCLLRGPALPHTASPAPLRMCCLPCKRHAKAGLLPWAVPNPTP